MEHFSHPWLAHTGNLACPFYPLRPPGGVLIIFLIRRLPNCLTRARSTSSTHLACHYRRCFCTNTVTVTSTRRFRLRSKCTFHPRSRDQPRSTCCNACLFIHPIRISGLQRRWRILGCCVMGRLSFRESLSRAMGMPTHAAETRDGKTAGEWLKLFLAPGL